MPEYLAPGVYVEEIDTGSKPIEGVSTSTTGMVGVTERGPTNIPILVTSYGDYMRWFGERLNIRDFTEDGRAHCYLPHAVEGFFTNGGKRLYVVRVLDTGGADPASFALHNRGDEQSAATMLLRPAGELSGTIANTPLYVLDLGGLSGTGTLADGDRIRIGDGSAAMYRVIDSTSLSATHVPLSFPLSRTHDAGLTAHHITCRAIALRDVLLLTEDVERGAATVVVTGEPDDIAILDVDQILQIGPDDRGEHRFVTRVTPMDANHAFVGLDSPLEMNYAEETVVTPLEATDDVDSVLEVDARAGDRVAFVVDLGVGFVRSNFVEFDRADSTTREVRRIGDLYLFILSAGAYGEYPASTLVAGINLNDDERELAENVNPAIPDQITVDDPSFLSVGDTLRIGEGTSLEEVVIAAVEESTITLRPPGLTVPAAHSSGDPVVPGFSLKELTADLRVGTTVVPLDNRVSLEVGDVIRIGHAPDEEYATIAAIPNPAPGGIAPNVGNLVLTHPLNRAHLTGTAVRRQNPPTINASRPMSVLALDVPDGETLAVVTDGASYSEDNFIRIITPEGRISYHRIAAEPVNLNPSPVTLTEALTQAFEAGAPVVERARLIEAEALDAGIWGNRLRISVENEATGLVTQATLEAVIDDNHIRPSSVVGVESGTILELLNPLNDNNVIDEPLKVVSVDRSSRIIALAGTGLGRPHLEAERAARLARVRLGVRSCEFSLTIHLLRQPDMAMPSRDEQVIDTEVFRHLSMDSRHTRYIQTIIGTTWLLGADLDHDGRPLRIFDRRSEGESKYIRIRDLAQDLTEPQRTATLESIRIGPEVLTDALPTGRRRPARHPLTEGSDSIASLVDDHYIGGDHVEPENRTGLYSLRNIDEISLVACPGQTTPAIQQALIDHCELMRYRFAVLDGEIPPRDTLMDVQMQRQQFDTKYAALYHPWLLIDHPFPANLAEIEPYPIPPSGHILGVYARTDIERGVHKAPANEVVRGILGLQRSLNKGEHEILNPYPVNINVIRDFRPNNRGIRVWGGRVITSDPDWKYVNVRRLLIFIEYSIERGLQWVVFEPNAEPLWARVRRVISNFLTVVWRNGALEGTTVEEAFFVKCDRTTMTQTDIDNGRLICVVGVAPVKPAEFVIIRIGLWTAHAEE